MTQKIEIIDGVLNDVKDCGWCYNIKAPEGINAPLDKKYGVVPKVGQKVRLHVVNFSEIWGMDIEGQNVFMHTPESMAQERAKRAGATIEWLEKSHPKAAALVKDGMRQLRS